MFLGMRNTFTEPTPATIDNRQGNSISANVNGLSCKDVDSMFHDLKLSAANKGKPFIDELRLVSDFLESEAMVNTGNTSQCVISERMLICSQNASFYITNGLIVESLGEIWDVVDYHDPDDELSVMDIVILSLLTKMLYHNIKTNAKP